MFTGFPEAMIQFFLNIRFNNYPSFLQEHREEYLRDVQEPFYAFIQEMGPFMQKIDPAMEIRPVKCLARIHRDTRFTKDKSPFRDHLWLLFRRAAEPRDGSLMYWFEISPEKTGWGLGFWGENRPVMDLMRRRMAANPQAFERVLEDCHLAEHGLQMDGQAFKRMDIPEQIPPSLRFLYSAREMYIEKTGAQLPWIYSPDIVNRAAADYQAMAPLYKALRGLMEEVSNLPEKA